MRKPLAPAPAAQAAAKAAELAKHSMEQAKTAYLLAASLHLERARLLCPEKDAYDISQLSAAMRAAANELRDPALILRSVSEKGRIDPRFGMSEPRPSQALRKACQSILAELEAASEDLPGQMASELAAMTLSAPRSPR